MNYTRFNNFILKKNNFLLNDTIIKIDIRKFKYQ